MSYTELAQEGLRRGLTRQEIAASHLIALVEIILNRPPTPDYQIKNVAEDAAQALRDYIREEQAP